MHAYTLKRIVAYGIDAGITSLFSAFVTPFIFGFLASHPTMAMAGVMSSGLSMIMSGIIPIAVFGTMTGLLGYTPGKFIMALRVQQRNGKKIDIGQGILRELIKYVATTFMMIGMLYALYGLITAGKPFYDEWLNLDVDDLKPIGLTDTQKNWRKFQQKQRQAQR